MIWSVAAWAATVNFTRSECEAAGEPVVRGVLARGTRYPDVWMLGAEKEPVWILAPGGSTPGTVWLGDTELALDGLRTFDVDALGVSGDVVVVDFVPNCGLGLGADYRVVMTRVVPVPQVDAAGALASIRASAEAWAADEGQRLLEPEVAKLTGTLDSPSTTIATRLWWADDRLHVELRVERVVHVIGFACGNVSADAACRGRVGDAAASRTYTRTLNRRGRVVGDAASSPEVRSGSYPPRP